MAPHQIQNAIHIGGQRILAYLHAPRDTGSMSEAVDNTLQVRTVLDGGPHFQVIPVAPDGDSGIDHGQLRPQAAAQDADETVPHLATFYGDLGEKTYNEEHEGYHRWGTILR